MAVETASVKINKELIKKANVCYAKTENDILNQEGIVKKALEFFAEHYPKIAESQIKRKQSA